jgi:mono/diheme cytochrome c family protein
MRKPLPALVVLLFSICAAGFAQRKASESRAPRGRLEKAPAAMRSRPNPYEGQPGAILAGRKLFLRHCAECHGEDGRGTGRAANLHSAAVQQAPPGELVWFLKNGSLRAGMPSWSRLPEQRRWQIVTYLKTLQ